MHGRWQKAKRAHQTNVLSCPSYDDLRMESAVFCYVVGEGHHDKTIPELSWELSSLSDGVEGDAVERAVREFVGAGLLRIDGGRVVPVQSVGIQAE